MRVQTTASRERVLRFALKGHNKTAQGNALGVDSVRRNASPERAA